MYPLSIGKKGRNYKSKERGLGGCKHHRKILRMSTTPKKYNFVRDVASKTSAGIYRLSPSEPPYLLNYS